MKRWSILTIIMVMAMILAACGPSSTPAPTAVPQQQAPTEAPKATEAPAADHGSGRDGGPRRHHGADDRRRGDSGVGGSEAGARAAGLTELADAYAGKYKGTKVTMTGPFTDDDAVKFDDSMKAFEDATGIDIQYEGSKEFEATITVRVEAGDLPDIVDFPQPGLLATFVKTGQGHRPVDQGHHRRLAEGELHPVLARHGAPCRARTASRSWPASGSAFNGKCLVWYPKKAFDAAGYKIPTTWDELHGAAGPDRRRRRHPLVHRHRVRRGHRLARHRLDRRDHAAHHLAWRTTTSGSSGELKFDSPEVKKAVETCRRASGSTTSYVYGGQADRHHLLRRCARRRCSTNPPKCWLHKQGNFITTLLPRRTPKPGVDYDFFYLPARRSRSTASPSWSPATSWPCSTTGPKSRAVMEYFTTRRAPQGLARSRRRHRAAQGRPARLVRRSTSNAAIAEIVAGRDHRPLRRLRPDARRGRRRLLLEGHDRLGLRRRGPRHRAQGHRRLLAASNSRAGCRT